MHTKAITALIFTILIWGITSAFARGFSLAVSPVEALIIRTPVSAVLFAIALVFGPGFYLPRKDWPKLILLSLVGMLGYYMCSVFGFAYAPAGLATLVFSIQPLMIAIVASLVGVEKLTTPIIIGLLVSLAGTAILVFDDPRSYALSDNTTIIKGVAFMFASCIAWTIYVIFTRPLIQEHGAVKITGLSCVIIAIPLLPFINTKTIDTMANLNGDAILSLAFLTTLAATTSVATWNYAAGHLRPTLLGSSMYIIPLVAIAFAWLWLNEPVTPIVLLAGTVILTGVAIAEYGTKVLAVPSTN
jgi:drug/metabolite transporter (DMT)-like permease